ncbi:protein associated with UVRAG as autophagy enhancer isoform X2 [Cololabis saira]|uniref:protein associated with UVRAG as autophagy enhancer isoform X2 n=1 Tax=Cololabis saira TaxID=129043 RepID=UPI002AD45D31|nr:protein associated with UVRAG as autophagy enhancer isoform X2 [Cololabis saira]
MRSCSVMYSDLHRCGYVSWCVEPAESPAPAAAASAATLQHLTQSQQSARSKLFPLLILAPSETSGGEATIPHQCPQETFLKKKHSCKILHKTEHITNIHCDEGNDSDDIFTEHKRNLRLPEGNFPSKQEAPLLYSEEGNFLLPRSSPVISRRRRHVPWQDERDKSPKPSRSDCPSPSTGSPSVDQHEWPTASIEEDPGSKRRSRRPPFPVQADEKPRCVSLSSDVNSMRSGDHQSHSRDQQGLAKEHRRRCLTTPQTLGKEHSGIPEFPADIFRTSCELEKENAHFIVVDLVLEVLEGAKWSLSFGQRTSRKEDHQHTECNTCMHKNTSSEQGGLQNKPTCTMHRCTLDCSTGDPAGESYKSRHSDDDVRTSHTDTHFSYGDQHVQGKDEEESENEDADDETKTLSVLSTDSGFEDSGFNAEKLISADSLRNAEWLAQQLVSEFKRRWLPSRDLRRDRQSLRTSLQELAGSEVVAASSGSLAEEIQLRTRMRGSLNWAPPRFQIIFTVQPTHRRSDVVASQNFLCAGCGTGVEPRYIKKLRYCEYLGRYFCDCCHSGSEAVIPGRVLSGWDFSRYLVSNFSKQLLDSLWHQPLFDLSRVGKTLNGRVKEVNKFKDLQEQLLGIKKLLTACRFARRKLAEFEQLPAHLMGQPLLFSMDDLVRLKKGQLLAQGRAVLQSAVDHVQSCELCLARGFICEFCKEKDIIFPFQSDICKRCTVCKACFHKHCFEEKKCPKCERIWSRMKVQLRP